MSVRRVSVVVAMLLAFAPFAVAQQDAGSKARDERAAFKRALDAGLAKLAFLEGSWRAEQATPDGKGGWKATGTSDVVVTKILGGKALQIEAASAGFNYLLHLTFDAEQSEFRVSAIDDQSGLLDVYEGAFDGGGALVVSNVAAGTGYTYLGVHYSNRLRFQPRAESGWEWLVEASSDRGATWRPQLRVLLARAGARP
jgi:hypothetical protein